MSVVAAVVAVVMIIMMLVLLMITFGDGFDVQTKNAASMLGVR